MVTKRDCALIVLFICVEVVLIFLGMHFFGGAPHIDDIPEPAIKYEPEEMWYCIEAEIVNQNGNEIQAKVVNYVDDALQDINGSIITVSMPYSSFKFETGTPISIEYYKSGTVDIYGEDGIEIGRFKSISEIV